MNTRRTVLVNKKFQQVKNTHQAHHTDKRQQSTGSRWLQSIIKTTGTRHRTWTAMLRIWISRRSGTGKRTISILFLARPRRSLSCFRLPLAQQSTGSSKKIENFPKKLKVKSQPVVAPHGALSGDRLFRSVRCFRPRASHCRPPLGAARVQPGPSLAIVPRRPNEAPSSGRHLKGARGRAEVRGARRRPSECHAVTRWGPLRLTPMALVMARNGSASWALSLSPHPSLSLSIFPFPRSRAKISTVGDFSRPDPFARGAWFNFGPCPGGRAAKIDD